MKKIIAAMLSLCVLGGSVPAVQKHAPEGFAAASAAEEGVEVNKDGMTYLVYDDHAVALKCDYGLEGEFTILDTINGVPVTEIGYFAFSFCDISSVIIPDSVKVIDQKAFIYCYKLESAELPDSLEIIGDGAFYGNHSLKSVSIPASVYALDRDAFIWCDSLEKLTISDDNRYYAAIDNVMVNKKESSLMRYSFEKKEPNYIIPDNIVKVGEEAFWYCANIGSVVVPESVERIEESAFDKCSNLRAVTILNPDCKITGGRATINNESDHDENDYRYSGVIFGYTGSTAQAYSEKYGYRFIALDGKYRDLGKTNSDDKITAADATAVLVECASLNEGVSTFSESQTINADMNYDGKITAVDASLILKYCAYLAESEGRKMDCMVFLASIGILPEA